MTTRHRVTLGLLALFMACAVYVICIGKDAAQWTRMGDAALFEQIIENIHVGRGAVSNVFANTQNYIEHHYIGQPDTEMLARELQGTLAYPDKVERNMLGFHAYFILYPVSLLLWLTSSSMALTIVQTLSYAMLAVCAAAFVLRKTGSATLSLLFATLVVLSPQLYLGMYGQFYPDRIFVAFGFILLWCLYQKAPIWKILCVCVLLISTNERAALIGGLLIGLHAILFCLGRADRKRLCMQLALAMVMVLYAFLLKKFVLSNLYYDSFLPVDFADLVYRYTKLPGFAENLFVNLKNNAFLLLLAACAPRYFIMAIVVLLPNLVGNIGGAEKVGWATHYHSYYFPVLCFAAAAGLHELSILCRRQRAVLLVAFLLFVLYAWFLQERQLLSEAVKPSAVMRDYIQLYQAERRGERTGYEMRRELVTQFEAGALVATNEQGMAMLHQKLFVTVYPLQLSRADYVYINCADLEQTLPESAQRYAGKTVRQTLEERYGFRFRVSDAVFSGACIGVKQR